MKMEIQKQMKDDNDNKTLATKQIQEQQTTKQEQQGNINITQNMNTKENMNIQNGIMIKQTSFSYFGLFVFCFHVVFHFVFVF